MAQHRLGSCISVHYHLSFKVGMPLGWVFARILKMLVLDSYLKISACPDLATDLFKILIPTTFNNLLCQKGEFILKPCPKIFLDRETIDYYLKKVKFENYS